MLIAAVLMLSACGGSGGSSRVASLSGSGGSSATASAAASGDLEKELADYMECLRKQGVDVPDPTVDADGNVTFGRLPAGRSIDRDQLDDARKACGKLPEGLTAALTGQDQSELQDTALKFAKCMREQGVDVPDPDFSKIGGGAGGPFGDLDRDDPKVAAALEVCQKVWAGAGITLRGGQ